jgi:hypothetical protein
MTHALTNCTKRSLSDILNVTAALQTNLAQANGKLAQTTTDLTNLRTEHSSALVLIQRLRNELSVLQQRPAR